MWNIKDIMQIGVCSFCENIYENNSLEEIEFEKFIKDFIVEEDLQDCLERSTNKIAYDIENIENIYNDTIKKNNKYQTYELINICKKAYRQTILIDQTINVEAFVDNLIKEF